MNSVYAQSQLWSLVSSSLQLLEVGPALPSFLKKSSAHSLDEQQTLHVLQNAQYLQSQGYPPGPYLLKANEAIAKGAPPQALRSALAQSWQKNQQAGKLTQKALSRGWAPNDLQHRQYWTQYFYRALDQNIAPEQIHWLIEQPHPQDPQRANLQLQRSLNQWQSFPESRGFSKPPHSDPQRTPSLRPDFQSGHRPFSAPSPWSIEKKPKRHGPPQWKAKQPPTRQDFRWNSPRGPSHSHPGKGVGKAKGK